MEAPSTVVSAAVKGLRSGEEGVDWVELGSGEGGVGGEDDVVFPLSLHSGGSRA